MGMGGHGYGHPMQGSARYTYHQEPRPTNSRPTRNMNVPPLALQGTCCDSEYYFALLYPILKIRWLHIIG